MRASNTTGVHTGYMIPARRQPTPPFEAASTLKLRYYALRAQRFFLRRLVSGFLFRTLLWLPSATCRRETCCIGGVCTPRRWHATAGVSKPRGHSKVRNERNTCNGSFQPPSLRRRQENACFLRLSLEPKYAWSRRTVCRDGAVAPA